MTDHIRQATTFNHLNFDIQHIIFNSAINHPPDNVTPLLLSSVCPSWREVVRTSPLLWTRLNITLSGSNLEDSHTQAILDITKDWLIMSKDCSLDVRVSIQSGSTLEEDFNAGQNVPVLREFLEILYQHRRKWKSISVPLTSGTFNTLYNFVSTTHPPNLSTLTFDGANQTAVMPTGTIIRLPPVFNLAVHERSDISKQLRNIYPQWSALTNLLWDVPIRPDCVRTILSSCTSATNIQFKQVIIDEIGTPRLLDYVPIGPMPFNQVCLPELRRLDIVYIEYTQRREYLSSLEGVLNFFTMPNLMKLSIHAGYFASIPFTALAEFAHRSQCTPDTVSLTGIAQQRFTGGSEEDLNSCLMKLRSVEELSISACAGFKIDVFWKALKECPLMLPRMKLLRVRSAARPANDDLVRILSTRHARAPSSVCLEIKLIVDLELRRRRNVWGESHNSEETVLVNGDRAVSQTVDSDKIVWSHVLGKVSTESEVVLDLDNVSTDSWDWLITFVVCSWMELQHFPDWLP